MRRPGSNLWRRLAAPTWLSCWSMLLLLCHVPQVNGADKPLWRWMPSEEQLQRLEPLARQLQREQALAAKAAAAQEAGSSSTAAADS